MAADEGSGKASFKTTFWQSQQMDDNFTTSPLKTG